jgi:flavin reductase (DIM6/NTAB) family NADH-FMN oxidoreductase RutF
MKTSIGPRTLIYPTPALIVGTYDKVMKPNGMTAAWTGICCSKPPCVYVSLRKATYSHGNIVERKAYTLSIPSEEMVEKVDYLGMASGREEDKFAAVGLTPVRGEHVEAPYVAECPVVLECRLVETVELGLHTQFVGEVVDVKADEDLLGEDGVPDMARVKPLVFAPESRGYYKLGDYLGRAFSVGKRLR